MATRILCNNAELIDGGNRLKCTFDNEMCAYQMYCRIVDHATNTCSSTTCKRYESKRG